MANTIQITPFMHVAEIGPAVRFLTEVIGFEPLLVTRDYAYLEREGAGLRLQSHGKAGEIGTPHRGFAYYIDVRDLDVVIGQIGDRLAALPPGDVHGPVEQDYGQRELLIRAPDGNLIVFGQAMGKGQDAV